MNNTPTRALTHEELDFIGALRLRPNSTLNDLSTYMGTSLYHLTETALRLAKWELVCTSDAGHSWCAMERGAPVTESVLPALLNQLGKGVRV